MITIRVLELISFFFLLFELKMLVSYKSVEYERKKYLVATFVMCLPAILMSIASFITSIVFFNSISYVLIDGMLLTSFLFIETITLNKIRKISFIEDEQIE